MKFENKPENSVLILGAGELGWPVLLAMSSKVQEHPAVKISVLLRSNAAHATSGRLRTRLDDLMTLGIAVVEGDLQENSVDELSALFGAFSAVINCSGFVGGPGTQIKITQAVLKAGVPRYFPWQFGVDYDVVGSGQRAAGSRYGMNNFRFATFCAHRAQRSGLLFLREFLPAICLNLALVWLTHKLKLSVLWETGTMR